nr:CBS domain-containing protein [Algibacillus agarilyticus]
MSINQIMSTRVVSVQMDDTLATAKQIFENTKFHHLLVIEKHKLVGVVSDRDILKQLSPFIDTPREHNRDTATLNKKIHQMMSRDLVVMLANEPIAKAVSLFNQHAISCIPIIDENNEPIGIVSWRDVMRYLEHRINQRNA